MYKIISSAFILLMLVAQQCMAVDESIYYGKWEGVACNNVLFLALSKQPSLLK